MADLKIVNQSFRKEQGRDLVQFAKPIDSTSVSKVRAGMGLEKRVINNVSKLAMQQKAKELVYSTCAFF